MTETTIGPISAPRPPLRHFRSGQSYGKVSRIPQRYESQRYDSQTRLFCGSKEGRPTGLEPATPGTTTRCSTN